MSYFEHKAFIDVAFMCPVGMLVFEHRGWSYSKFSSSYGEVEFLATIACLRKVGKNIQKGVPKGSRQPS